MDIEIKTIGVGPKDVRKVQSEQLGCLCTKFLSLPRATDRYLTTISNGEVLKTQELAFGLYLCIRGREGDMRRYRLEESATKSIHRPSAEEEANEGI